MPLGVSGSPYQERPGAHAAGTRSSLLPIRRAFSQPDREQAGVTWRDLADRVRARWPELAVLMDDSEHDMLASMAFPAQHRTKLHSTNPIERLDKEVKRRADVAGIFRNEASIARLIGRRPLRTE